MKPYLALILLSLSYSQPCARAIEASPKAIDDRQISTQFEKKLGGLKDDHKTPEPDAIQKQLKERQHHEHELPTFAPLGGDTPTTADVYDARSKSVLCFGNIYKCDRCDKWHGNIAGGFVISEDGLAVTNYHVMENAKAGAFGAMTIDGEVHAVEEVLAASKRDDLAIVRLAGRGFTPAPIKPNASVGSKVIAISHPEGRFYSVSEGIISRYYRQVIRRDVASERLAITADFAKGSSGSPVFSDDGGIVGVVSSTNSIYYDRDKDGAEHNLQMVIKSCIPSSAILELLSKVEDEKIEEAAEDKIAPEEQPEAPEEKQPTEKDSDKA